MMKIQPTLRAQSKILPFSLLLDLHSSAYTLPLSMLILHQCRVNIDRLDNVEHTTFS